MCGINGIFGLKDQNRLEKTIVTMNRCIEHRGPDDTGTFCDHHLALGHQRLSILDLSEAGHQPMKSFDGRYVVVFNGEIYNYRELKGELGEYQYSSTTDTEVILAAYMKWGKGCVEKFNGMFAFAIWDTNQKELFIARDRLGIKPLYYYKDENLFLFSSEVRALLESELIPKNINRSALVDYLKYQTVHAPETMVKGVQMLMPGHYMTITEDKTAVKKYWNLSDHVQPTDSNGDYAQIKQAVRKKLEKAVERRMIADVPIGAFLSGGIDSSAIVALMSQISPGNVKTFSVTFDESKYSEAPYARMIAEKFDTEHTEIRLTPDDFLNILPEALGAMDHPSGDGPNTYLVSKVTREAGVKVALSGLGGDELFAGYRVFRQSARLEKYRWFADLPQGLRTWVGDIVQGVGQRTATDKISELVKQPSWDLQYSYPLSRQAYMNEEVQKLLTLNGEVTENRVQKIVQNIIETTNSTNLISRVSCSEIETYMQNTLLRDTDQMSMASALEVRVPFLDHELVEYVLSLSDSAKYPSSPKKLLVDALYPLLPDEIVNRKKMGFTFPWDVWMRNELREETTSSLENLADRAFFDADSVMDMWNRFLENDKRINWARIWILVVLEQWLEANNIN